MRSRELLFHLVLLVGTLAVQTRGSAVDEAVGAVTASFQREIESLKEQLESYETKHDTLEAATEQFRLKAKNLKQKLEDERKRYDTLADEKQSLDNEFEGRLQSELEKKTIQFEEYKKQQSTKQKSLSETIEQLHQRIEMLQKRQEDMKLDFKTKLSEEQSSYKQLQQSKATLEEKMKKDIGILSERLNDSEQNVLSLEQTLNATLSDEKEKDSLHQKELRMRIEEAKRWEARIKELNEEKKEMFSNLKRIETELGTSRGMASTLQQKLAVTQNQLLAAEETIQEIMNDVQSKEMENASLRSTVEESQQKLAAAERRTKELSEENNRTGTAYEEAKKQLAIELRKANEAKIVATELESTRSDYMKLRNEVLSLEKQLNTTVSESSQCFQSMETMKFEYNGLDGDHARLRLLLSEKEGRLGNCESELEKLQTERWQCMLTLEEAKNRTVAQQQEVLAREEQVEHFKSKYADLEAVALHHNKEYAELRSRHADLAVELESARKEARQAEELVAQSARKLQECHSGLQNVRLQCEEVERVASDHKNELVHAAARIESLLQELDTMGRMLNDSRALAESCSKEKEKSHGKWLGTVKNMLQWVDYCLYRALRVIVDSPGYVVKLCTSSSNGESRLFSTSQPFHQKIMEILTVFTMKCKAVHGMIVAGFNWGIAAAVRYLSGPAAGQKAGILATGIVTTLTFLQNHIHLVVFLLEAIGALLCIDFMLSSFLLRRRPGRMREKPTGECGSLLRKAKNFQK